MNKEKTISVLKTLKHRGIAKNLSELERLHEHKDFYLILIATAMEGKDISAIEKIEALRTIEYIIRQDNRLEKEVGCYQVNLLGIIEDWRNSLISPRIKVEIKINKAQTMDKEQVGREYEVEMEICKGLRY